MTDSHLDTRLLKRSNMMYVIKGKAHAGKMDAILTDSHLDLENI